MGNHTRHTRTITDALKPYKAETIPASRRNVEEPADFFTIGAMLNTPTIEPWPTQIGWLSETEM